MMSILQPRSATLRIALVFGFGLVSSGQACAADPVPRSEEKREQAVEDFIEQFVELGMFDGSVVIDVGGTLIFERSFGRAQYEFDVPHDEFTRFRIASVSKSLTDAAFARLVSKNKLDLDSKVSRFLPDFPLADNITVAQLLSHTSGIPHTNDQSWGDGSSSLNLSEIVERLARLPLDFEPGTDRRYSNGGYAVAARVLEVVGGGTYSSVMHKTVFGPLGMNDTGHIDDARSVISKMATGYEPGSYPGERRHARFYAVETRPGGGSLYSTTRDLLRFMRGVFREGFVSPELQTELMGADADGFLSQGRSPGFVAKVFYGAEHDVFVVSLANNYAVPADWVAMLAAIATGSADTESWPEVQPTRSEIAPDDSRLGRYRSSRGGLEMVIGRTDRGAMTMAERGGQSVTALIPLVDGSFLMPLYFQKCEQEPETRVLTCMMLSGNERYTSTLTPLNGGYATGDGQR